MDLRTLILAIFGSVLINNKLQMKKLIRLLLLFIPLVVFGQDSLYSASLYFIDWKVEGVEIIEIDDLNVKYKYKGEATNAASREHQLKRNNYGV